MGSVSIKDPGNTARTPQPPLKGPENSPSNATRERSNNPSRFHGKKQESIIHEGCMNPTYLTLSLRPPKQTSPIFIFSPESCMNTLYSLTPADITMRHNKLENKRIYTHSVFYSMGLKFKSLHLSTDAHLDNK